MSDPNHIRSNSEGGQLPGTDIPLAGKDAFQQLLAHACDGILDADEAAELSGLLRNSSEARRQYLTAMGIETLLTAEHEDSLLELTQVARAKSLPGFDEDLARPAASSLLRSRGIRQDTIEAGRIEAKQRTSLRLLTVLAASLLLATAATHGWSHLVHDRTVLQAQRATLVDGKPVGEITETVAAKWEDGSQLQSGYIVGGQNLMLREGVAKLKLSHGAVITVEAPAHLEVVSGTLLTAHRGTYRATVGNSADQFVIRTPSAQVVNVGPDLQDNQIQAGVGVEIAESGATDVIVYDGQVSLQLAERAVLRTRKKTASPATIDYTARRSVRQLGMGEGVHVERSGKVERIYSIVEPERSPQAGEETAVEGRIINAVFDDQRGSDKSPYYRIVPGGFRDDARAYVDRFHQWNGLQDKPLPQELVGADYAMTFNRDKWAGEFSIHVDLAAPATLYLFMDDRVPAPQWLVERFRDTGWNIGLDEGWHAPDGRFARLSPIGNLVPGELRISSDGSRLEKALQDSTYLTGQGPAQSIDATFSVWSLAVQRARRITLGAPGQPSERTSMYGIAAVRQHPVADKAVIE